MKSPPSEVAAKETPPPRSLHPLLTPGLGRRPLGQKPRACAHIARENFDIQTHPSAVLYTIVQESLYYFSNPTDILLHMKINFSKGLHAVPEREHWVLTSYTNGEVQLYDSKFSG